MGRGMAKTERIVSKADVVAAQRIVRAYLSDQPMKGRAVTARDCQKAQRIVAAYTRQYKRAVAAALSAEAKVRRRIAV
jgi:hypothetical protein